MNGLNWNYLKMNILQIFLSEYFMWQIFAKMTKATKFIKLKVHSPMGRHEQVSMSSKRLCKLKVPLSTSTPTKQLKKGSKSNCLIGLDFCLFPCFQSRPYYFCISRSTTLLQYDVPNLENQHFSWKIICFNLTIARLEERNYSQYITMASNTLQRRTLTAMCMLRRKNLHKHLSLKVSLKNVRKSILLHVPEWVKHEAYFKFFNNPRSYAVPFRTPIA